MVRRWTPWQYAFAKGNEHIAFAGTTQGCLVIRATRQDRAPTRQNEPNIVPSTITATSASRALTMLTITMSK